MRPWQHVFVELPWLGAALFQVTLLACLGLLLAATGRRWGPAGRSAALVAVLGGVVVVPLIGILSPVWLPVPAPVLPAVAASEPPVQVLTTRLPVPTTAEWPDVFEPGDAPPAPARRVDALADTESRAAAPAAAPAEPAAPFGEPAPGRAWTLADGIVAVWLVGALACTLRALLGLAYLARCRRRSVPVTDPDCLACLNELSEKLGLRRPVALRESAEIAAPLTMGWRRPAVLLPSAWRGWSADERALILAHELAHVRRRDFLAGLLAELTVCLYWFHPLVRWLAGRLRLEQEFAADAAVMALRPGGTHYAACLARRALELDRGAPPLAPALWRRRPEILRRIHMLRLNPAGQASTLGRWSRGAVALAASAAYLAVAGLGVLHSADPAEKATEVKEVAARADLHGDALPAGAVQRLGTVRFRYRATAIDVSPDGKLLAAGGADNQIRLFDAETGKEVRRLTGHLARSYAPKDDPANPISTLVNATG